MPEAFTSPLARSPPSTRLGTPATRLVAAPDRRGHGCERRGYQPVDETRSRGRSRRPSSSALTWGAAAVVGRPAGRPTRALAPGCRSLWLSRPGLDSSTRGRRHAPGMWCLVPSIPCQPPSAGSPMEPATAHAAGSPARRSSDRALAPRDLASPQQGAPAQQPRLCCIDASGVSPVPSVVRTSAPVGHTPILREWGTREQLSAISALSPEGQLDVAGQDRAINAAAVVGLLEHLRREVAGRMVLWWDGAPMHRRHLIHACLGHGAAERMEVARLPAYAPELNPHEGLWGYPKGVELRNVCCVDLPHLHRELRAAVKRVRRKARVIEGCFRGAKL
jgi:transposase